MTGEPPPHRIVRLEDDAVVVLDQRRLPEEEVELRCATAAELAEAIRVLAVRGAPAIGVAAAYGLALAAERGEDVDEALETLAASRPTAVNLRWALEAMRPDPTRERAERDPRGRGRALPAHGRARASSSSRPVPACSPTATPAASRRAATARRSARSAPPRGRPRRARLGRRDAPAAPGRPADRLGARAARHPALGDRRRRRRVVHGPRRGRPRRHRRRPDRGERRHREQDRHVLASPCSPPITGSPARRRRADVDARSA